jgi:hypothetical protein
LKDPHYPTSGPFNTIQIQLFSDGRIIFAYNGIGSLDTGTIVGLTPGPNSPSQAVNYTSQTNVDIPAGTAVYEYFNSTLLFNLDQSFIVYTPNPGGGYNVRTLTGATPPQNGILTGAPSSTPGGGTPETRSALIRTARASNAAPGLAQIANSEIIVHSSVNPKYIGMTNSDAQGNFVLTSVPKGGILAQVRKNGRIIAEGSGVFAGGKLSGPQVLSIVVAVPATSTKVTPQGN